MANETRTHRVELYAGRTVTVELTRGRTRAPVVRLTVTGRDAEPGVLHPGELRAAWNFVRSQHEAGVAV